MEKQQPEAGMCNALHITPDAAKDLTKLIKGKLEGILDEVQEVHELILEAHGRRAHQALGYSTWAEYVKKEFNLSQRRSYQLLDRARVQQALLAAGLGAATMIGTPFEDFPGDPVVPTGQLTRGERIIQTLRNYSPRDFLSEEAISKMETPPIHMSARAVQNLKPQLDQAVANVEKLVKEGEPIVHAVQTVVDQYGKPIEPEHVTEDTDQDRKDRANKLASAVRSLGEWADVDVDTLDTAWEDSDLSQTDTLKALAVLEKLGF